ncbi:hypothetical protein FB451DRAFT_1184903 [Mycena latifolia]|nr:hypothetical protein FB451DRAFT_1184903 [Mycena latifolia]
MYGPHNLVRRLERCIRRIFKRVVDSRRAELELPGERDTFLAQGVEGIGMEEAVCNFKVTGEDSEWSRQALCSRRCASMSVNPARGNGKPGAPRSPIFFSSPSAANGAPGKARVPRAATGNFPGNQSFDQLTLLDWTQSAGRSRIESVRRFTVESAGNGIHATPNCGESRRAVPSIADMRAVRIRRTGAVAMAKALTSGRLAQTLRLERSPRDQRILTIERPPAGGGTVPSIPRCQRRDSRAAQRPARTPAAQFGEKRLQVKVEPRISSG